MRTVELNDGTEPFAVTVFEARHPECLCLFAVGAGGNPLRHGALLQIVADRGCTVIAPHYPMLTSLVPGSDEVRMRIRRLELSAAARARTDMPLVGIGHSIGTVTLLALAGAQPWTASGRLSFRSQWQLDRLALLAPPTDFFRHPDGLANVAVPMLIRAGGQDTITPIGQAQFLKEAVEGQAPVELHIDQEAGHFSYMDELPPHITDPHPDRAGFLADLAEDVARFVTASN